MLSSLFNMLEIQLEKYFDRKTNIGGFDPMIRQVLGITIFEDAVQLATKYEKHSKTK